MLWLYEEVMSKKNLKEKLKTMGPNQLFKWLSWILAFAASITVSIFMFYFINFNGGLSSEHERWGAFGDFIGGTLNPILSFMALIALLLTIVLQNRQIEISSNELELSRKERQATREELKRSASAQEKSEIAQVKQAKALEISARISAITKLLDQSEDTMRRITSWSSGSRQENEKKSAEASRNELQSELQSLYKTLKEMDNEKP